MNKHLVQALSILIFFFCHQCNASATSQYRHCIRMSFTGDGGGTITNLCNKALYAIWYDDAGEHDTAIGKNGFSHLGRIRGSFQVKDAMFQNDSAATTQRGIQQSKVVASTTGNREAACRDRGNSCGVPCMDMSHEAGHACAVICDKAVETCERTGRLFNATIGYNATARFSVSRHSDDLDDDTSIPAATQGGNSYQVAPMIQYRPISPVGGHVGCARVVLGECR